MERASWFFDPPPLFSGGLPHFFVYHGHTKQLGKCDKMAFFGGVFWEPCECAHLAEKYDVPTVEGHRVTRDFEWLPLYTDGANPKALAQNLKNALLPQWNHFRVDVHSYVRRSLRDIPILGNNDHLFLSAMARVQGFYSDLLAATPKAYNVTTK